jgi:putative transposase
LISDGARNYHEAYNKELFTLKIQELNIFDIFVSGDHNNNKSMERMNGEVRDREERMRGLKNTNTPILKGYQIFYNYLRGYEGLEGKTPAEVGGIEVKGNDKWLTIIQNPFNKSLIRDIDI